MSAKVTPIGDARWRRFVIITDDRRYWDGIGFTPEFSKALKYAHPYLVSRDVEEIGNLERQGFFGDDNEGQ